MQRILRSLVALALVVSVPSAAWATCAESQPVGQTRVMDPREADSHGCCSRAQGSGELPDCCQVKRLSPQAVVLMTPPALLDLRVATPAGACEVAGDIDAAGGCGAIARAQRVLLKLPHPATYLRISVLLI